MASDKHNKCSINWNEAILDYLSKILIKPEVVRLKTTRIADL